MTDYEIIRAACIKANSRLEDIHDPEYYRPIRLADVLLAIMKKMDGHMKGNLKTVLLALAYGWNCFADDLAQQSPETLAFLAELLSSEKI